MPAVENQSRLPPPRHKTREHED